MRDLHAARQVNRWRDYLVARVCYDKDTNEVPARKRRLLSDPKFLPEAVCSKLLAGGDWSLINWHSVLIAPLIEVDRAKPPGSVEVLDWDKRYSTERYLREFEEFLPPFMALVGAEVASDSPFSLTRYSMKVRKYAEVAFEQPLETRKIALARITAFLDAILKSAGEQRSELKKAPAAQPTLMHALI